MVTAWGQATSIACRRDRRIREEAPTQKETPVTIVNKPKPGTRYGDWIVPKGCVRVALDSLGRPMWNIVTA